MKPFLSACATLACSAAALALPGPQGSNQSIEMALRDWRAQHGDAWRVAYDPTTGYAEMVFGGRTAPGFRPRPGVDGDWIALARAHVGATIGMHGIDPASLEDERATFLPLGQAHGGTDKVTVRLRQVAGGVPVVDGAVNVLMDTAGGLRSVHSTATPFLADLGPAPRAAFPAARAREVAAGSFTGATLLQPTRVGEPELVAIERPAGEVHRPLLAWQVDVEALHPESDPQGFTYWIDATTGAILERRTSIHYFDVGGTVVSNATPGTRPDKTGNPPVQMPMPYMRVTSSAGTTFTDANGAFNFPGASGPLNVTVDYRGTFNRVFNDAGAEYTLTQSLTGTGNTVVMNPSPTQQITAQANGYLHINTVRDYIRGVTPADSTADFEAISNVNLNSTCNAFFSGSSVNYYLAGGGCVNTAYSTVIAHEFGHWLNVLYGTGNGSDGMGEGNADVFAMYVFDDAIVGREFCGSTCDVRDGNNLRQFCGDTNPGCHGGVHADGEVWMGAAWKVRDNLDTTLGGSAGDATADALFMGWMNAYNQQTIRSIIETQWLTLDDDDGDIGNGTPNYGDIDAAFRTQGFPGFDLDFITFSGVTQLPHTTDTVGPYVVDAHMVALLNPPIATATLHYSLDGGAFVGVPMTAAGDDYTAAIPGQSAPTEVRYYVRATDAIGNPETFPAGAPGTTLLFGVGRVSEFLVTDFEPAGDEGWTVGDVGDDATTGIWVRVDPRGTAAQPEDDHTAAPGVRAWVTGQGPAGGGLGDADVDGGKTTLKSPIFDASEMEDPKISYWRWYSNSTGAAPGADVFDVDVSNDGGSTWTRVERVGPSGPDTNGGWFRHDFDVSSIVPLTATMQLRFVASDEGDGSLVEAALDDIAGFDIAALCTEPQTYGMAKLNSALVLPEIGWSGTPSVATGDFAIDVATMIAGQFAILISGSTAVDIPFFGGRLLVGGGIVRERLILLDGVGSGSVALTVTAGMVGQTRHYQYWYRDPAHPDGTGVGLSNGLTVEFCD